MDVDKYLLRIGVAAPVEPSLATLRSLHTCHLLSVPFENLTVHSGGLVRLDLPVLYEKVVNQRRGGFCFENNGLFSWLLGELGFTVTLLAGQVRNAITGCYGPPFDHLVLLLTVEGRRWLCDVGFGGAAFIVPLSLDTGGPQVQGHRVYRLRQDTGMYYLEWQGDENRNPDADWTALYKFTLEPRRLEDFSEMCMYHQRSPSSVFFCKSLCTVYKPDGRVTYIGRRLTTTSFPTEPTGSVSKTTRDLEEEEIPGVLEENFGIVLLSPLKAKDEEIAPPSIKY